MSLVLHEKPPDANLRVSRYVKFLKIAKIARFKVVGEYYTSDQSKALSSLARARASHWLDTAGPLDFVLTFRCCWAILALRQEPFILKASLLSLE